MLEMLAIMEALKVFRCYVHGRFVRIFTDHHSLRFFETQPKLNQRQVRWMEILQDYNYKIEYKSGAKNHVADALSRHADYIPESGCMVNAVTTAAVEPDFLQGVIKAYSQRNVVLHVRACACLCLHVCMYMCIRARDERTNASKQSVIRIACMRR